MSVENREKHLSTVNPCMCLTARRRSYNAKNERAPWRAPFAVIFHLPSRWSAFALDGRDKLPEGKESCQAPLRLRIKPLLEHTLPHRLEALKEFHSLTHLSSQENRHSQLPLGERVHKTFVVALPATKILRNPAGVSANDAASKAASSAEKVVWQS